MPKKKFSVEQIVGDNGFSIPLYPPYRRDSEAFVETGNNCRRLRDICVVRIKRTSEIYLAVIEDNPCPPFFFSFEEQAEKKVVAEAAERCLIWRSKMNTDPDPFGFRMAFDLMGSSAEPLIAFFRRVLSK